MQIKVKNIFVDAVDKSKVLKFNNSIKEDQNVMLYCTSTCDV